MQDETLEDGGRSQDRTADFHRVKVLQDQTQDTENIEYFEESGCAGLGYDYDTSEPETLPGRLRSACIAWDGYKTPEGYGRPTVAGKKVAAHRHVWEQAHGPIPAGLCVLHLCDQPSCVNLDHLVLGTQRANMADRQLKKRQAIGERNGRALLTAEQAQEIRRLRLRLSRHELAARFGVSRGAIEGVLYGENWAHLPAVEPLPPEPEAQGHNRRCRNCGTRIRGTFSDHWAKCIASAVLAALLVLAACGEPTHPLSTERTQNPQIDLELLFEKDGCRMYAFAAYGSAHYWASCPGLVDSPRVEYHPCGKGQSCARLVPDFIQTSAAQSAAAPVQP